MPDDADEKEVNRYANVECILCKPWGWFGWIMLLIGLLFIGMMAVLCFR